MAKQEPDLSEFDEIEVAKVISKKPPCLVAAALEQLSDEDRETVVAVMERSQDRVSNQTIAEWFGRRGVKIEWQSVRNHRSGRSCRCVIDG